MRLLFYQETFNVLKQKLEISLEKLCWMELKKCKYWLKYLLGKSAFVTHCIALILSSSVLLWFGLLLPVTKGDPLYDANDNTNWCSYFDEISFVIVSVPFFEIFNEWQSCVAAIPKQNRIPDFEKELHAPIR